jgi:hypothetical protein
MRLVDLDPQWIVQDGRRLGFTFQSPTKPEYRQSCFCNPPKVSEQVDLFDALHGEHLMVQPCNPKAHWQIAGGIDAASFDTMTVKPSLDGGAGGLWHGFITDGQIVGGI